jgi:hypothetical protein
MIKQENITIEGLKKSISKLKYKWFEDQLNLIAIRTNEQIPDVFNDWLCLVWKQPILSDDLTPLEAQQFLNKYLFTDDSGNKLKEDGNIGKKTREAFAKYDKVAGKERLFTTVITTEPGVYYQKKLLNKDGCWVMMPAQMLNAYKSGFHQGKSDHRALRSVGKIFGLREDDKDGIALNDKNAVASWVDGHLIGANLHGALKKLVTKLIGPWSAGCTVVADWDDKEIVIDICDIFKDVNNGLITYTLITENDYTT